MKGETYEAIKRAVALAETQMGTLKKALALSEASRSPAKPTITKAALGAMLHTLHMRGFDNIKTGDVTAALEAALPHIVGGDGE